MKKLITGLSLIFTLSLMANFSFLEVGTIAHGGSGCPSDTATVHLDASLGKLNVIFSGFEVVATKGITRKNCQFVIPLHVPKGFTIALGDAEFTGSVKLPKDSSARFTAEHFFAGSTGTKVQKEWIGSTKSQFQLSTSSDDKSLNWSPCGNDVNLRLSASMLLKNQNKKGKIASATVNKAKIGNGFRYQLHMKQCF